MSGSLILLIHLEIPLLATEIGSAPLTVHALLRVEALNGLTHALVRQGKDVLEALTAHCSEGGKLHLLCRQDNGIVSPAARQGRFRSARNLLSLRHVIGVSPGLRPLRFPSARARLQAVSGGNEIASVDPHPVKDNGQFSGQGDAGATVSKTALKTRSPGLQNRPGSDIREQRIPRFHEEPSRLRIPAFRNPAVEINAA